MFPDGSPTASPCVSSDAVGNEAVIPSKFGVRANATALPSGSERIPQPSSTQRATGPSTATQVSFRFYSR